MLYPFAFPFGPGCFVCNAHFQSVATTKAYARPIDSFNFISLRADALGNLDETKNMENILMIQVPQPAGIFNFIYQMKPSVACGLRGAYPRVV